MRKTRFVFGVISISAMLLVLWIFSGRPALSQEKHKVTAQLVLVDVTATDRDGQTVRGLTKDDFQITEDGKAMNLKSLDFFDFSPTPPSPSTTAAAGSEARKGRLIVVFDSLNTIRRILERNRALIIDRLLELIRSNYEVMVFELKEKGEMEVLQPFTSDEQLIRQAVSKASGSIWVEHAEETLSLPRFMLEGERNRFMLEDRNEDNFNRDSVMRMYEFETRRRAEATVNAFLSVLAAIKDLPGRKPVLLISGGFPDVDLDEVQVAKTNAPFRMLKAGRMYTGEEIFDDLEAFANSFNIAFYSLYCDDFLRYVLPDIALDNYPMVVDLVEIKKSEVANLGDLAKSTGGLAMLGADKFQDFQRLVKSDLLSYYELSYVPPRKTSDGKYHKIALKTKRPGIHLRHRRGYFDYDENQRESLLFASAAFNPSLFRNVPFAAKAISVAVGPRRFRLWMTIDLPIQTFLQNEVEPEENRIIKVGLDLIDAENSLEFSARINAPLKLSPEFLRRLAKARHFGFSACSQEIEFKKDHYRAVIALFDQRTQTISTVEVPLDVPDPSGTEGSILQAVFGQVLEIPDAPLEDFSFSQTDGALQFLRYRFYPLSLNDLDSKDKAKLYLQVRGAQDERNLNLTFAASRDGQTPEEVKAQEMARSRNKKANVWNGVFQLDLSPLTSGDYMLQISRRGRLQEEKAMLLQVPFRLL